MPYGRWNHNDQRNLCGAYQDNRIVPYEGVVVSSLSDYLHREFIHRYRIYVRATFIETSGTRSGLVGRLVVYF
jgi:hypothetical protein